MARLIHTITMNESEKELAVYCGPVYPAFKDLTGKKFGKLTVESRGPNKTFPSGTNVAVWNCRCECGGQKAINRNALFSQGTRSCGCLWKGPDGSSKNRSRVSTYEGMIQRCHNPSHVSYPRYGGRGIVVCDHWRESVANFIADMGHPPADRTLDREDNDGPYCKDNCKWATKEEQTRNMRSNRWIEIDGEKHLLSEWAKMKGMKPCSIYWRLRAGWPERDAVMTPKGHPRKPPIQEIDLFEL